MRQVPVLVLLLLIGACQDGAGLVSGGGPAPLPVAEVRASFPRGAVVDAIQVDATDRLPLRAAELVAPGGEATPASNIDVVKNPHLRTGQRAAEGAWHDALSAGSVATALTMPNAEASAALQSRTELLATVSTATIPLPDPVAYRRDWGQYRIRLTFGTPPGDLETREIPAPAPPPNP
jgi:hypothetical protein